MSERSDRNYRAIRDMGLAAWWGSSLAGLGSLLRGVGGAIDDPAERARVLDAGWKASRGLTAGAVTAYVWGTSMVRYDGAPFDNGVPKWINDGPENAMRATLTGVALGAAVAAMKARNKGNEIYAKRASTVTAVGTPAGTATGTVVTLAPEEKERAERLERIGHAWHVVVPAAVGALMFSHLKQDMRETSHKSRFRR
ncbi:MULTISPECIES: hypothetical protein [unclassified Modestobacter]|uniref:hypothetical protein n=1 Tax=unclassified Modestobacter TaxID=2643866 RepID=UPI0022AB3D1A|nr:MULTISPECIES: hypothetical protein [unclassified Modestobacter]MCZ2825748.1 hypothetical protein [Modestobacter sp. VKM Ac-2981]MCZ2853187.1 hypothetical protein [Modestobacter sp. VKM Ac-2982]